MARASAGRSRRTEPGADDGTARGVATTAVAVATVADEGPDLGVATTAVGVATVADAEPGEPEEVVRGATAAT